VVTILPNSHALVGDLGLGRRFSVPAEYKASGIAAERRAAVSWTTVAAELQRDGMIAHRCR